MENNFVIAIILTFLAGISTGIGSLIGLFAKKTNTNFLSGALGFSAGVMLFVSFVDIYPKAYDMLLVETGEKEAGWLTLIGFFIGIILICVIDKLIPKNKNPHECATVEELNQDNLDTEINNTEINNTENNVKKQNLMRMGVFTALAIGIHNFPEGLATFVATLAEPSLGIPIAIAIALHNIPEGLAVSVPIYYATGSRKKAFIYSFLSGISEPIGAIVGYLLLRPFLNDVLIGIVFAAVAGVMVFITLDELLPAAKKYGKHHTAIYGLILGMLVMAVSLQLL